jgi:putative FmdB family regulatory protein
MPLYDYQCSKCEHIVEDAYQSIFEDPLVECPNCKENQLCRIITGGVHVFVKGSSTPVDIRREEVPIKKEEPKKQWYHSHGSASASEINKMTNKQKAKYIMENDK